MKRIGIEVSQAALRFDIPVMVAVAAACLPVFFIGYRMIRVITRRLQLTTTTLQAVLT